jgi:hypothetical protein
VTLVLEKVSSHPIAAEDTRAWGLYRKVPPKLFQDLQQHTMATLVVIARSRLQRGVGLLLNFYRRLGRRTTK